jgi:hypothetical protein
MIGMIGVMNDWGQSKNSMNDWGQSKN